VSAPERGPLLAIDTSTVSAGIALYAATGLLAECAWPAGRAQTTTLLPEIARLTALCGLRPADLGAIAVASGPGTFNGLRVGMSTAKGLAHALGVPLLGVPTLDVLAYPHGGQRLPIRAVIVAGRGRYVSARYVSPDGVPRQASAYANTTLDGLAGLIDEPTLVCGELPFERLAAWRIAAAQAQIASPALGARRAGSLAEIAWARLRAGEYDDPATLEPIYVHGDAGDTLARSSATTPATRDEN
jgi:tRNA threonylcarbamoyladenosine biosynthesis protein TsaB